MVDKKGADHAGSFWSPEVADDEREGGGGQASAVLYSWREQEGNPFKLLDKVRGLSLEQGQARSCVRASSLLIPSAGAPTEGVPGPQLEKNADSKTEPSEPCQGKARPCGPGGMGNKLVSQPCLWLVLLVL